jgi:hypothetical protein
VEICGGHIDLSAAVAYHDHNWGRWRWGDDIGWEWGCFADRKHRSVFVYTQTTDRDHRRRGRPMLLVYAGGHRRTFAGLTVVVDYAAELATSPRRVPGALAALHSDRAQPRQPTRVELRANDGVDSVHLRFHAEAVAQILTAEPTAPGYGFIHEIAGRFEASGQINRTKLTAEGLAIVEHVD